MTCGDSTWADGWLAIDSVRARMLAANRDRGINGGEAFGEANYRF
jgi:hypothetical protein